MAIIAARVQRVKEEPSWTVWLGLPLVMGSGLYILHRERVRTRDRAVVALP